MTPARIRGRPFCIRGSCSGKQFFRAAPCRRNRFVADAALFCIFTGEHHGRKDHQPGKRKDQIRLPPFFQPGALPRRTAGDFILYRERHGKVPGAGRPARRALSGGGSCGRQAGRRGHPSGCVRRVPHPGAYLGRSAHRRAVSGPGAGAGPRQRGHPAAQRGGLRL